MSDESLVGEWAAYYMVFGGLCLLYLRMKRSRTDSRMSDGTMLSDGKLAAIYCDGSDWKVYGRAVERAVLEAVGWRQYAALNRGIIADLAPVNSQPHSYARGAVLEAVDTITALRAFHDRAIEILGAHGALDQGVEVDALTWLADVLTQADGLRARVAELERENTALVESNVVLESKVAEMEAGPGYVNATGYLNMRDERDAARRELEEAREDTARLDWLVKSHVLGPEAKLGFQSSMSGERHALVSVRGREFKGHSMRAALDLARARKGDGDGEG